MFVVGEILHHQIRSAVDIEDEVLGTEDSVQLNPLYHVLVVAVVEHSPFQAYSILSLTVGIRRTVHLHDKVKRNVDVVNESQIM